MGFEPMRPWRQTVFKTAPLWPLRYLSILLRCFSDSCYSNKWMRICQQLFLFFLRFFRMFSATYKSSGVVTFILVYDDSVRWIFSLPNLSITIASSVIPVHIPDAFILLYAFFISPVLNTCGVCIIHTLSRGGVETDVLLSSDSLIVSLDVTAATAFR